MKRFLVAIVLAISSLGANAQKHVFPATDTVNVFTAQNSFSRVNSTLYVGMGVYSTPQVAVSAACALSGQNSVVIPVGTSNGVNLATLNGCATVNLIDMRAVLPAYYGYTSPGVYTLQTFGGGGGSGSVTSVSATGFPSFLGSLSVTNQSTTPLFTFTPPSAGINTVLAGPPSGSPGTPTYQTAPTFSAANLTNFPTFNQNTTGQSGTVVTVAGLVNGDGTTVTRTGSGTIGSPYIFSAVGGGGGTVTAVSVATANGFQGTSSGGATPALTLNVDGTHFLPTNTGSSSNCWKADGSTGACGSGAITSVFGRTGVVVATSGDYSSFYCLLTGCTFSGPVTYTGSGSPITIDASSTATPVATKTVLGTDASGNFVSSDNGAAAARVCNATNGICTSASTLSSNVLNSDVGTSNFIANIPSEGTLIHGGYPEKLATLLGVPSGNWTINALGGGAGPDWLSCTTNCSANTSAPYQNGAWPITFPLGVTNLTKSLLAGGFNDQSIFGASPTAANLADLRGHWLAWAILYGIPDAIKIAANNTTYCSTTGTWTSAGAGFPSGSLTNTSGSGSVTCTNLNANDAGVIVMRKVSDTATFTLGVNGSSVLDPVTNSTTIGTALSYTGSLGGTSDLFAVGTGNTLSGGTTTITLTVTASSGGNPVTLIAPYALTPISDITNSPPVLIGLAPFQCNNGTATATCISPASNHTDAQMTVIRNQQKSVVSELKGLLNVGWFDMNANPNGMNQNIAADTGAVETFTVNGSGSSGYTAGSVVVTMGAGTVTATVDPAVVVVSGGGLTSGTYFTKTPGGYTSAPSCTLSGGSGGSCTAVYTLDFVHPNDPAGAKIAKVAQNQYNSAITLADKGSTGSGGGTPGGSNGDLQYNCSGALCGSAATADSLGNVTAKSYSLLSIAAPTASTSAANFTVLNSIYPSIVQNTDTSTYWLGYGQVAFQPTFVAAGLGNLSYGFYIGPTSGNLPAGVGSGANNSTQFFTTNGMALRSGATYGWNTSTGAGTNNTALAFTAGFTSPSAGLISVDSNGASNGLGTLSLTGITGPSNIVTATNTTFTVGTPQHSPGGLFGLISAADAGGGTGGLTGMQVPSGNSGEKIADSLLAAGHVLYRICLDDYSACNTWMNLLRSGDVPTSLTFGEATIAPNITDSALTSGQCVQAGTGGILTVSGSPCINLQLNNVSWSIQPVLFATTTMLGPVYFAPYTSALNSVLVARLSGTISCTVAPVVALMDLGTSATTAYGSATNIGSLTTSTSDGVFTATGTAGITTGHYYGVAFSSGTCVTAPTIDISAQNVW